MGNKSSSELTLYCLLIAALCLEAFIIDKMLYCPAEEMNWTEARQYCQKNHIDLVTWNTVDKLLLTEFLLEIDVRETWIGLLRDPETDSVWKWINVISGEGISGGDLSQSSDWADGQQSSHCAVVEDDSKWQSVACSHEYDFYCSDRENIQYHKKTLNWSTASQYCKRNRSDLATITRKYTDRFKRAGWIGLYREAGETWNWIGDQPSDYRNWAQGEPRNTDCGYYDSKYQKWYSNSCLTELKFVCYDDNLVVVKENKTWEDALIHCRSMETPCEDSSGPCKYRHDLLSWVYSYDYNYVRDRIYRATTDEVWTGLHFLGGEWLWASGTHLKDKRMLPDCPSPWTHCGTLSKHDTNNWIIRDCSERRNFICYKEKTFQSD